MQMDDDIIAILNNLAANQTSNTWAMQTILRLALDLQTARQTLRVAEKLAPPAKSRTASQVYRSSEPNYVITDSTNADSYLKDPNKWFIQPTPDSPDKQKKG